MRKRAESTVLGADAETFHTLHSDDHANTTVAQWHELAVTRKVRNKWMHMAKASGNSEVHTNGGAEDAAARWTTGISPRLDGRIRRIDNAPAAVHE